MPEIIKILLPTNIYTFLIWIVCVVLILFKSRRVSTKWFTLDLERIKPSAGAQGELILKDRILKEYKIFKTSILFEINKLQICFKSNFRDSIINYIDNIESKDISDYIKNKQTIIKMYNTLLDLSLNTIVKPMLIDMIFRNGFPKLPSISLMELEPQKYKDDIDKFEKVCIEKYNTLLSALELNMETDWADFSIDPNLFKSFYHTTNTTVMDYTRKETIRFFKILINQRDEMIKLVYKDFSKIFIVEEKCHGYCSMYLRELYE